MKKRNITLLTAIAAAAAFASSAQATISGTGQLADASRYTVSGIDWTATGNWNAEGIGTVTVDGGSVLDASAASSYQLGWAGSSGTITVTGTGSQFIGSNNRLSNNLGDGYLNIEAGGSADFTDFFFYQSGKGFATVTGAGSKLTASTRIVIGWAYTASVDDNILTIADGGLVQTDLLKFSLDENRVEVGGYVHMDEGGILAVSGDKTFATTGIDPFVDGGLFTKHGALVVGEIQYDNGGWTNMTGATEGVDYTLTYETTGIYTGGYTVLTMLDTTTPAADPEITSITSLGGGVFELTLKGDPSTSYEFYSSATLDFTLGGTLVPLTAGGTDVTTDGSGDATVQMSLAGSANFVRAQ